MFTVIGYRLFGIIPDSFWLKNNILDLKELLEDVVPKYPRVVILSQNEAYEVLDFKEISNILVEITQKSINL